MKIQEVKINGIANPIGFSLENVICSWKVTDTKSQKQKGAKIEVSLDEHFKQIICCKEGEDLKQQGEKLDLDLKPRTTYYYRVTVDGDQGDSAVSETCIFETGKMQEEWQAEWIAAAKEDTFHPVLRKVFSVEKPVRRVRVYVV